MIQELRIKNFLSFKDEVVFSFEATKDTTFEEYQVVEVAPGVRLLRFAMVYGANASGKSNLLRALGYLREFWFAIKQDIDRSTESIPFLFDKDTPNLPSEFEMTFYVGSTKFRYMLSLDSKKVLSEKLYYYNSAQPTQLFAREWEQGQSIIKINQAVGKVDNTVLKELNLKCLPNMSFFAARNQVNCHLPVIDEARHWMRMGCLPTVTSNSDMYEYAQRRMRDDSELKNHILDFVKRADFNITGITTQGESAIDKWETLFEHTVKNQRGSEQYALPSSLQSEGTRRTIGIEAAIYGALRNEQVLPIDEIEASLHPDLVEFIIEQFLYTKNRSQLLITSHYDPLLNTAGDLIRKDSIWFTEKGKDGSSQLYSLVEFKGLNKIKSLTRSYRNGIFGALPNIIN